MVSVTNKILTFKLHVLVEVKLGYLSYWDSSFFQRHPSCKKDTIIVLPCIEILLSIQHCALSI